MFYVVHCVIMMILLLHATCKQCWQNVIVYSVH